MEKDDLFQHLLVLASGALTAVLTHESVVIISGFTLLFFTQALLLLKPWASWLRWQQT
jgi:hypothetical protein